MIRRFALVVFATGFYNLLQAQQWNRVGAEILNTSSFTEGRTVEALYVLNGKLYVSGAFRNIGTETANSVASWDGNNWDTLNYGLGIWPYGGIGYSFTEWQNNLIVGGSFNAVDTEIPNTMHIAGWDGQQWFSLSPDNPNGWVQALQYKDKLYVGGAFYNIGAQVVRQVASWNGQDWEDLDGGLDYDITRCKALTIYDDKLIAGGNFYSAGAITSYNIAAWDGQTWNDLDTGLQGTVNALVVDTVNNILYAGGTVNWGGGVTGQPLYNIGQWDGIKWNPVGGAWIRYDITSMCMYHGELFAGCYSVTDTQEDTVLMKWNGWEWQKVLGLNGNVHALAVYNDELYVGGSFHSCGNDTCHSIARYYAPPDTTLAANKPLIKETAWLYDNRPNPSIGPTQIPYYLPQGKTGELYINDTQGREIKHFALTTGKNYIEVNTKLWTSGVYINTLVWDGWKRQSKRMVVE